MSECVCECVCVSECVCVCVCVFKDVQCLLSRFIRGAHYIFLSNQDVMNHYYAFIINLCKL